MHTPEPWAPFDEVAQQMHPILDHQCAWLDYGDYYRAKICVDACAKISSKSLQKHTITDLSELGVLAAERDEIIAQRDELLAMVYELLPYIEESDDGGYKKGVIPNLVKKINNLIKKCEV